MTLSRRRWLLAAVSLGLPMSLAACGDKTADAPVAPVDFDPSSTCDLDGMLLADYPGPKAQIHYVGQPRPVWFCDTVEMFSALLKPEQVRSVAGVFVQDMARADWDQPRGHWFDARQGVYVFGSKRQGSMGPTIASFQAEADASRFVATYGGRMVPFADVKPDMVDLSGGGDHDSRM